MFELPNELYVLYTQSMSAKATQIYLFVLPNRRRKFPKMEKKKLKFRKFYFYFFRRRGFIYFKVKKNENCFFLTVPMQ